MSKSPSKTLLRVRAPDEATEIFLIDPKFRRIAQGCGELDERVEPGLYKIRYRSGETMSDQLVEVPEQGEWTVYAKPVAFRSAAPLEATRPERPAQRDAARRESDRVHASFGAGAQLFVMVRDPEGPAWTPSGITLHDAAGEELFDLSAGAGVASEAWAAANLGVAPGTYRLRVESPPLGTYEMFLVASGGWQTQVFLGVEEIRRHQARMRAPALRSASILMERIGRGFEAGEHTARLADLARLGLDNGRSVLTEKDLSRMLRDKFEHPMLGIYAGHLLLLTRRRNRPLLQEVCTNLRRLVGEHPDAEALRLEAWKDRSEWPEAFTTPPMLRSSWDVIMEANRRRKGLVQEDTLIDEIADGLARSGPWVLSRLPDRPAEPTERRSLAEGRRWLDEMMTAASRVETEFPESLRRADLTGLDRRLLQALKTTALQVKEEETRPTGLRLERNLARKLSVPMVSVERSVRKLAAQLDPDQLEG